ncbi:unnamed protein product [Cylicocyclus nassatus]|uniref:Uncharacterized protein n=1 Tax=Cylicocyclus nassatus TaxID=53992 RepID=A0AA36HCN5_CYLNA|nr:unnamed protein product [Cylicocyclus nassatus]
MKSSIALTEREREAVDSITFVHNHDYLRSFARKKSCYVCLFLRHLSFQIDSPHFFRREVVRLNRRTCEGFKRHNFNIRTVIFNDCMRLIDYPI